MLIQTILLLKIHRHNQTNFNFIIKLSQIHVLNVVIAYFLNPFMTFLFIQCLEIQTFHMILLIKFIN